MEIGVIFLGFMVCFGGKGFWFLWLALGKRNSHFYCSPQARKRSEQWKGRSQRSFVFISEAFTWGIIFQAPEDQRKLQSSARISIGGDDPRCYCQNYFRVLFTCRAAGKRPTVRPLEVEAGERDGEATENQDIWRKTRFDRNVRGLEAEMIQGKASTLEEAEMTHTHMDEHSPMHIDLTNTSACRYIYVCNVSPRVHVCILSCWHIH